MSSGTPTIRISGLGKRYHLRMGRDRRQILHGYETLREALTGGALELVREVASRLGRGDATAAVPESFWALKDVSLEVGEGEVVGIIGPNGAGKSTLLKILSRITRPTTGAVALRGRVGSLLEIGTGFHPELTGRENIFLSGAILGMRRAEIHHTFGRIVEFAEVERFIDMPVKRYSSGMYLRLAFAVAAHLQPEILLVDEVLAVGDAAFQRKCLGKMGDVAQEGRSVLFVSHNMDAILRLCPRSVLIEQGHVSADGASAAVVSRYLSSGGDSLRPRTWIDLSSLQRRRGSGDARFLAVRYSGLDPASDHRARPGDPLAFTLRISSTADRPVESLAVVLSTRAGTKLINADTVSQGAVVHLRQGETLVQLRLAEVHLNPGVYVVGLWLARSGGLVLDYIDSAFELEVAPGDSRGLGLTPAADGVVPCRFEVAELGQGEADPDDWRSA